MDKYKQLHFNSETAHIAKSIKFFKLVAFKQQGLAELNYFLVYKFKLLLLCFPHVISEWSVTNKRLPIIWKSAVWTFICRKLNVCKWDHWRHWDYWEREYPAWQACETTAWSSEDVDAFLRPTQPSAPVGTLLRDKNRTYLFVRHTWYIETDSASSRHPQHTASVSPRCVTHGALHGLTCHRVIHSAVQLLAPYCATDYAQWLSYAFLRLTRRRASVGALLGHTRRPASVIGRPIPYVSNQLY